jgi:hypothetical protein
MAVNIFDKYGIKEVANVYFEALEDDLKAGVYKGDIVLFLDTLKVSTIETSAESVDATGGWGNAKLITWDYGKEITLTLEDALISLESLRFMLGGAIHKPTTNEPVIVRHTEEVVADANGEIPAPKEHLSGLYMNPVAKTGHAIRLINLGGGANGNATAGTRTQIFDNNGTDVPMFSSGSDASTSMDQDALKAAKAKVYFYNPAAGTDGKVLPAPGDHIRIFWEEVIANDQGTEQAIEVTISPDTFPGTYRVVGDTFMRSEKTGADEAFQFVINKAKVLSDVTITLEAEGDPSTFEMSLSVLRSSNERGENEMMKLIRYTMAGTTSGTAETDDGSIGTARS